MATDPNITNAPRGSSCLEDEEFEPESFLEQLISVVALEDVERINQTQKNMLNRFEKTNEMLVNCNALGQIHFEKLNKDYRKHTARLVEMHKDLDWIFHRIRFLKQKLKQKYPDVACETKSTLVDDEEEEDVIVTKQSQTEPQEDPPEDQIEADQQQQQPDISSSSPPPPES